MRGPGMCACGLIEVGLEGAAVVAERRKYGTVTHSWDECYAVPYDGIGEEVIPSTVVRDSDLSRMLRGES